MINQKMTMHQIGKILFETDNYYKALTYLRKYFDTNQMPRNNYLYRHYII